MIGKLTHDMIRDIFLNSPILYLCRCLLPTTKKSKPPKLLEILRLIRQSMDKTKPINEKAWIIIKQTEKNIQPLNKIC